MTRKVAPAQQSSVVVPSSSGRKPAYEVLAARVNTVAQARRPFLGPAVHASQDLIGSLSYGVRAGLGLPCLNTTSTANDVTQGATTIGNLLLAINSYQNLSEVAQHATEAGDHEGAQVANVDRVRCVAQGIGGAYYVGVRALSAAAYVKGVDTSGVAVPTLLGRVTFVVSAAGAALWGLVYLILCVVCGMKIYHGHQFRKELEAAKESDDAMKAFVAKYAKESAKLERLTSAECVAQVKAMSPETVSAASLCERGGLIQKMEAALDKKFWINLGYLIACAIGVAATVASFIAMGPVGILIVAIAFVVVGTMMTGLDGYCLTEAIKEAEPGTFDKKMLAISSTVAAIAFAAAIALISVFSLGLVPLIAAIIIGAVWLGTNAYVWMTLREVERKSLAQPTTEYALLL